MSEDQFTKLFKYMHEQFSVLSQKIDNETNERRQQISQLQVTMDAFVKMQETDEVERLAMIKQLNRHDDWIGRAAKQLKIKYQST